MNVPSLLFGLCEFVLTLVLAVATLRISLWTLDRATPSFDEPAALRAGNAAVAVLHSAMLVGIALVVSRAAEPAMFAAKSLIAVHGLAAGAGHAVLWVVVYVMTAMVLAMIGLLVALYALRQGLGPFDAVAEVQKGNVAVAIVLAVGIVVVAWFLSDAVAALIDAVPPPVPFARVRTVT